MPTKNLTTPFARDGISQRGYTFGGGAETVFTTNGAFPFGYNIDTGGGNDTIFGSDIAAGDTLTGGDGDDTIFGGGGNDTINGGNSDGSDASKGQNPPPTNLLVGDGTRQPDGSYTTNFFSAIGTASNDTINGGDDGSTNRILADYSFVSVAAGATFTGGADTVTGGDSLGLDTADNDIFGDAETATLGVGSTLNGGIDTITGGFDAFNTIWGDVFTASFSTNAVFNGGNDILMGGDGEGPLLANQNIIYGDAQNVFFTAAAGADGETFNGGDDMITGGSGVTNLLFGDVVSISNDGNFVGGNDTITGGDGAGNVIYGDSNTISNGFSVTGGNDTLTGGVGIANTMYGDFNSVGNNADPAATISGGNDTLIGAANTQDTMWGDWSTTLNTGVGTFNTGADTFVIGVSGGLDAIMDFESGKDQVDLTAFGFANFDSLDPLWTNVSGKLALDFDGDNDGTGNVLLFNNIDFNPDPDALDFGLVAGDFIFA